jgi:hypothetical protein
MARRSCGSLYRLTVSRLPDRFGRYDVDSGPSKVSFFFFGSQRRHANQPKSDVRRRNRVESNNLARQIAPVGPRPASPMPSSNALPVVSGVSNWPWPSNHRTAVDEAPSPAMVPSAPLHLTAEDNRHAAERVNRRNALRDLAGERTSAAIWAMCSSRHSRISSVSSKPWDETISRRPAPSQADDPRPMRSCLRPES